jgi:predicted transcriptional regulator/transcriptional regulator with XRE-family HTH domain
MPTTEALDLLVFGRRLRHLRRQRGMTLDALGRSVGRPASYLSQLENGHREPRLSTVNRIASALGCRPADLLSGGLPNRRAELEVALARLQEDPRYRALRLPYLRPSARLDTVALEHVVTIFEKLCEQEASDVPGSSRTGPGPQGSARAANVALRKEMRRRDNYFGEIEEVVSRALAAVSYAGPGALSERNLADVAQYFGFTVERVQDLPPSTRSITDTRRKTIYVPQRNTAGGMRPSRSVLAQTLGHFALGHDEPGDFYTYVRQRVETNYFAGALLAPEAAMLRVLSDAKAREDISVEDLSEMFYISYEMAAHRLTNLITHHLGIPVHFQRSDREGVLWKAYENDGVLLPTGSDGAFEGQRLCRRWSSRQAFEADDSYALHYQYTETPVGTFWCATHIDLDRNDGHAVTVGTVEAEAHWFRGSGTSRRVSSSCPDPACCRQPGHDAAERWEGGVWASAKDQSHFASGLPGDAVEFDPNLGVELTDVYSFLDRRSRQFDAALRGKKV